MPKSNRVRNAVAGRREHQHLRQDLRKQQNSIANYILLSHKEIKVVTCLNINRPHVWRSLQTGASGGTTFLIGASHRYHGPPILELGSAELFA